VAASNEAGPGLMTEKPNDFSNSCVGGHGNMGGLGPGAQRNAGDGKKAFRAGRRGVLPLGWLGQKSGGTFVPLPCIYGGRRGKTFRGGPRAKGPLQYLMQSQANAINGTHGHRP